MKLFPESDLPYVAYNGGAEIVTALLGNHISAGFTPVVNFKPHKDIRVIAVCGAQRDPNYPDAPTFKEMFGDGFVFDSVYGDLVPAIKIEKFVLANAPLVSRADSAGIEVESRLQAVIVKDFYESAVVGRAVVVTERNGFCFEVGES